MRTQARIHARHFAQVVAILAARVFMRGLFADEHPQEDQRESEIADGFKQLRDEKLRQSKRGWMRCMSIIVCYDHL